MGIYGKCFVPLKSGLSLQMVMGDSDANCPYETSRKKSGMPHRIMNMMYGIRNTAAKTQ